MQRLLNELTDILQRKESDFLKIGRIQLLVSKYDYISSEKMEIYTNIYNAAMDDTDSYLVKLSMDIGADKSLTIEEKTDAIWNLFQMRNKKEAEERDKKQSSGQEEK